GISDAPERHARPGFPAISAYGNLVSRQSASAVAMRVEAMAKKETKKEEPKSKAAPSKAAPAKGSFAPRQWQSDVIVDLINQYGFPYIALNPGASYRGLHDSLVNYGGNQPPMLLCQHEKIAVQIAHGYAKATGKPMVAIVHNIVGMLHATMGIYYAYI